MATEKEATGKPNEVVIKLTDEQREHIKKQTGKLIQALKIETLDDRATPTSIRITDGTSN